MATAYSGSQGAERSGRRSSRSRQGIWAKSNMYGLNRAYPNAWFAERMISLWETWKRRHPRPSDTQPVIDGQQMLLALG